MSTQLPSFEDQDQSFDDSERSFPFVLRGRYEVIDKLGQGGMGTVYMARDLNLPDMTSEKRACVVKQLRDELFYKDEDREKALALFYREAQVLAALNHPNIVRVLEYFTEDEKTYLVMEYVQGQNLHDMVMERQEPFPEELVLKWAVEICDLLHYLHTHDPPVIYRDLKPNNIMIDVHDQVKLIDFGIARPFKEDEDNTSAISHGYSPPEQYWGSADPRSDVYSLGCTMYFLLTGEDPLAFQVAQVKEKNPAVSNHIDEVIQKATQQDQWVRFQSANEMKEILTFPTDTPKPNKMSPLAASIVVSCILGVFLLCITAALKLFDQSQMQPKSVSQYRNLEIEKNRLLEQQKQFEKQKREFQFNFLNNAFKDDGSKKANLKTNKANMMSFPLYENSDESSMTDPEGLN